MNLKLTKDSEAIFSTCREATLSAKTTQLINLAAHLGQGKEAAACDCVDLALERGATGEEINAVACAAACACGTKAQDAFIGMLQALEARNRPLMRLRTAALSSPSIHAHPLAEEVAPIPSKVAAFTPQTHSLDASIFQTFGLCTNESLDRKTALLVDVAACLVAGCECASGLIVQAQSEGATPEELARVGCLVACACGMDKKYTFLAALQNTESWKATVKEVGKAMHNP